MQCAAYGLNTDRMTPHRFNLCSNAGNTHTSISQTQLLDMNSSDQNEIDNTKFNTPAPHSHLKPYNTNESHDTGERKWIIAHNLDIFTKEFILTFVASGLDINDCVLSYFEGTANLHCYTSCTLTTLHCSKVSFLQCCHMKRYNKISKKMWGVYSLLWDTVSN